MPNWRMSVASSTSADGKVILINSFVFYEFYELFLLDPIKLAIGRSPV